MSECPLGYNGGSSFTAPATYMVTWGPNYDGGAGQWANTAAYDELLSLPNSSYANLLNQYVSVNPGGNFSATAQVNDYFDPTFPSISESTRLTESQVNSEVESETGQLPNYSIVLVMASTTPMDVNYLDPSGNGNLVGCAFHYADGNSQVLLVPELDVSDPSCNYMGTYMANVTQTVSHEYAEAVTDPFGDAWWSTVADNTGEEIGDLCQTDYAYDGLLSASRSVGLQTTIVQLLQSNASYGDGSGCRGSVTPSYWLATSEGHVITENSPWYGSPYSDGITLGGPVVGIEPTNTGNGYYVVAGNGSVFNYGDAVWYGSVAAAGAGVSDVVSLATTIDSTGYWEAEADGKVWNYGPSWYGSFSPPSGTHLVSLLAYPDGGGYEAVFSDGEVQGLPSNNADANVYAQAHADCDRTGVTVPSDARVLAATNQPGFGGYVELWWWPVSGTGGGEAMVSCDENTGYHASDLSATTEYVGAAGSVALTYNNLGMYVAGDLGWIGNENKAIDPQPNSVDTTSDGTVAGIATRP